MTFLSEVVPEAIRWARSGIAVAKKAQRKISNEPRHYAMLLDAAQQLEFAAKLIRSYVDQMQHPE